MIDQEFLTRVFLIAALSALGDVVFDSITVIFDVWIWIGLQRVSLGIIPIILGLAAMIMYDLRVRYEERKAREVEIK